MTEQALPTGPKARQLAMVAAAETLRDLQQILGNLGRDQRRTSPQFQHLMAQYKSLGTTLHSARQEVAPPPAARPVQKGAAPAPRSVSALGSVARRTTPVPRSAPAMVSALGRVSGVAQSAVPAAAPVAETPAEPQTVAPDPEVAVRVLAQAGHAYASLMPQEEAVTEETAPPEPPLELPLPLPKFTGTYGTPGSRAIDYGPAVTALQQLLQVLGYRVEVNGEYDVRTFYAVQQLQKEQKLPVTGVVGLETRRLLNSMVTG